MIGQLLLRGLGFSECKYNIVSPPVLKPVAEVFSLTLSAVCNDRRLHKHRGINQNVNMLRNSITMNP